MDVTANTKTYERADDYTIRVTELVERTEEIKLDDLTAKRKYLVTAKDVAVAWYDNQIADIDAMLGEAVKVAVVSEKVAVAEAMAAEAMAEESVAEEPIEPPAGK